MTGTRSNPQSKTPTTEAGQRASTDELTTVVDEIFRVFRRTWPRRFPTIWKTGDDLRESKRQWLLAFRDASVTPVMLRIGLEAVRKESWPPDNPGAFLALCRMDPATVGAPDLESAWKEASNRSPHSEWLPWSHRCVYWAAVWTGQTDLAERGQYMRKIFEREYDRALQQASNLSEPPLGRLPSKTSKQVQAEREQAASEHLPDIKAMVRGW
ncbi:replication protein P [Marinobacter sp. Hex_13]|uniref:replication protein P n=1 Tax=Marinobacter sp. Hex_13 TaxID=1795866 RepID=UPI00257A7C25|nr:replication protein P [Marinobacter sp. Hex_13]